VTPPHGDELAEVFEEPAAGAAGAEPAVAEQAAEPVAEADEYEQEAVLEQVRPDEYAADHASPAPAPDRGLSEARASFALAGQETAELDMQAVLREDAEAADPEGPVRAPGAPEQIPGQERLTFE